MNTKHQISIIEFKGLPYDNELAGSLGKSSDKSLTARSHFDIGRTQFIVEENRSVVLETDSLEIAIEKYNQLP